MKGVGIARQYDELVGRYQAIPFVKSETFDINRYFLTKAPDGLFHVPGEEERKIRTNLAGKVPDLLKEIFAK
jgi:hypothetical protein